MKLLINMVNKLNAYLEGRGSAFWTVGVVAAIVASALGVLFIGGLALWGLLSLIGLSVTYWGCVLALLCLYVLLKLLDLVSK